MRLVSDVLLTLWGVRQRDMGSSSVSEPILSSFRISGIRRPNPSRKPKTRLKAMRFYESTTDRCTSAGL